MVDEEVERQVRMRAGEGGTRRGWIGRGKRGGILPRTYSDEPIDKIRS